MSRQLNIRKITILFVLATLANGNFEQCRKLKISTPMEDLKSPYFTIELWVNEAKEVFCVSRELVLHFPQLIHTLNIKYENGTEQTVFAKKDPNVTEYKSNYIYLGKDANYTEDLTLMTIEDLNKNSLPFYCEYFVFSLCNSQGIQIQSLAINDLSFNILFLKKDVCSNIEIAKQAGIFEKYGARYGGEAKTETKLKECVKRFKNITCQPKNA